MSPIHPKTSAAALGGSLGVLIVAILASIHGVHLAAAANGAIPVFLATLGAYLSPSAEPAATSTVPPAVAVEAAQAPAEAPGAADTGGWGS